MENQNTIVINGNRFNFATGDTILDVARQNNIEIPTLCHLKGTQPTGSCRVCVVAIAGEEDLVTSCDTKAAAGMVVQTESTRVVASRKQTIKQMLVAVGKHLYK